jgi:hypothetical protein
VNLQQGVIDRHHKDLYTGPKDIYTGPKDIYTGPKAALLADSPSLSLLGDCTDGGKAEGITDADTALSPQVPGRCQVPCGRCQVSGVR